MAAFEPARSWLRACFPTLFVSQGEIEQRRKSKKIDAMLCREKPRARRVVKVLLLGAAESGKTTFLKQMRIIHGADFSESALEDFRAIIYGNVIKGMQVLVDARQKLSIPWGDEANESYAAFMMLFDGRGAAGGGGGLGPNEVTPATFHHYVPALRHLWADGGIQEAYSRKREFQLGDSVRYFLDELDRLGEFSYVPSRQDVLLARKATNGIVEYDFDIKNIPFKMVDVGGQRSQRRKWLQCFEGITSILFLVSSSEFDQVLMEDRKTNRLVESINIFETVVNYPTFQDVSTILFLNKTDLLAEKVRVTSIADYLPDFTGAPDRLEDVQKFLVLAFDSTRKRRRRAAPLFHHFTTAIDTENVRYNVRYVFEAVRETILRGNLEQLMIL